MHKLYPAVNWQKRHNYVPIHGRISIYLLE